MELNGGGKLWEIIIIFNCKMSGMNMFGIFWYNMKHKGCRAICMEPEYMETEVNAFYVDLNIFQLKITHERYIKTHNVAIVYS